MSAPRRTPGETTEAWVERGIAWEASPEGVAARAAEQARFHGEAESQRLAWLLAAGVPRRVARALGGELRQTAALARVQAGVADLQVLSGGVGTGKTVAACWWLTDVAAGGALYVESARLARWPRYDDEQMDRLLLVGRLVVDDLGVEFADEKGSLMVTLDEVLCGRHAAELPTVLTTNLSHEDFEERYQLRVSDRLREGGSFFGVGEGSLRGARGPM